MRHIAVAYIYDNIYAGVERSLNDFVAVLIEITHLNVGVRINVH